MAGTTHDEAQVFNAPVTFQDLVKLNGDVELPDNIIADEEVAPSAEISCSKLRHRHSKLIQQDPGTDVVDKTSYIHIARAAGTLVKLRVRPIAKPTGGDKQFTVDIKKVPSGTAVSAGTSLLTTPLVISSADIDNTNKDGSLAVTPTYAAGDMLAIIVDASGSTGSQGQGVAIESIFDESGV